MSVIATAIEQYGVTRIFFDCRDAEPDPHDEVRIASEIARACAQNNAMLAQAAHPDQSSV